jgi:hypothetical protein
VQELLLNDLKWRTVAKKDRKGVSDSSRKGVMKKAMHFHIILFSRKSMIQYFLVW